MNPRYINNESPLHQWWTHISVIVNQSSQSRVRLPVHLIKYFRAFSHAWHQRFWWKPWRRTYNFSWQNLDKIFSQKRCEWMLNPTYRRPFLCISAFHIPRIVVRKYWFRFPILPISQCDKAHFRVRNGAFQPPKWALLHCKMVLFAKRRSVIKT